MTPDLPNTFEAEGCGINYLKIPIADHWSQNLSVHFPQAIRFIGNYYLDRCFQEECFPQRVLYSDCFQPIPILIFTSNRFLILTLYLQSVFVPNLISSQAFVLVYDYNQFLVLILAFIEHDGIKSKQEKVSIG